MAGFLDQNAPSIEAEYVRYLEGDVFGKILFKNFALNIMGLDKESIRIPVGKWGDIDFGILPNADALIKINENWLDVEIKFSRVNIANKTRGDSKHNWAFNNTIQTPSKANKKYDILFAIGAEILGFENPDYWHNLSQVIQNKNKEGLKVSQNDLPHEKQFLNLCGVYILPFCEIPTNFFRITLNFINQNHLRKWFAWGWQNDRCITIWDHAVYEALKHR